MGSIQQSLTGAVESVAGAVVKGKAISQQKEIKEALKPEVKDIKEIKPKGIELEASKLLEAKSKSKEMYSNNFNSGFDTTGLGLRNANLNKYLQIRSTQKINESSSVLDEQKQAKLLQKVRFENRKKQAMSKLKELSKFIGGN